YPWRSVWFCLDDGALVHYFSNSEPRFAKKVSFRLRNIILAQSGGASPLCPDLDLSPELRPRFPDASTDPQVLVIVGLFVGNSEAVGDGSLGFAGHEVGIHKRFGEPDD